MNAHNIVGGHFRSRFSFSPPTEPCAKIMLRFWLPILLFLANIKTAAYLSELEDVVCHWVCETTLTRVQSGAKFQLNKVVDQNCAGNNSSTWIQVWFTLERYNRKPSEFSFFSFAIQFFSERVLSSQLSYEKLESNNSGVSCVLRPTSNASTSVAVNGLDALHSPLFYIRDNVSYMQSTPFMGYVNVEGNFYFSAGFTNAEMRPEHSLQFDDHWGFTTTTILSNLLLIVFALYSPYILTLFCPTIKTVQIERLSRATKVDEREEAFFDFPGQTLGLSENSGYVRVAAEQDLPVCKYSERSKLVDHGQTNGMEKISDLVTENGPPSKFVSQTRSDGNKGYRVCERSSSIEECPFIMTVQSNRTDADNNAVGANLIQEKEQIGVPHQGVKNKLVHVQVIDVGGAASPIGLRSFIANNFQLPCVKFVILMMFPLFILMWLDVFVLMIPRSFSRVATSLPAPFLTKSVYLFIEEKYPILYMTLILYTLRIFSLCFLPCSPNRVPSFLYRKHLQCSIYNNYLTQLVFPNNSFCACDECKETPDCPKHCEIPVTIKHNQGYSLLEIIKKNWKDVCQNLYPKCKQRLLLGSEEESSCLRRKFKIVLLLGTLFVLCIFLIFLDFIVSLPITSLCYGRVWFTANWFKKRYIQAGCLIIEFFVIFCSIVGVAYFSFCCALSMKVALQGVFFIGIKYPVEFLMYLASNIIVWHILWSCYNSFTSNYDDLVLKLLNACSENWASELRQYKEGDTINIPWKLFLSACDKLVPLTDSVKKLVTRLVVWVVGLFFVFSFIMAGSTDIPDSKVLSGTVTFLIVVHPSIWDFLLSRGKKKERKEAVLKLKVKDLVDAYFKDKLD